MASSRGESPDSYRINLGSTLADAEVTDGAARSEGMSEVALRGTLYHEDGATGYLTWLAVS